MRGSALWMMLLLVSCPLTATAQSPSPKAPRPTVDQEPVEAPDPEESASPAMIAEPEGELEEETEAERVEPRRRGPDRDRGRWRERNRDRSPAREPREEPAQEEEKDETVEADRPDQSRHTRQPDPEPDRGPGRMLTAIGVTGLQKVQLVAAFLKGAARVAVPCSSLGALRLEIIGELIARKPDEKKLETALTELQTRMDEAIASGVDLLFDLRGALTPEQNAKAIEFVITERLERGHRPGHGLRGRGERAGALRAALAAADLSSEQQAEVKRLLVARTPFFLRTTGTVMEKGFELLALLCDANAAKDAVLTLARAIGASAMEGIREGVVLALDVRDLMNEEQREVFLAHLDTRVLLAPSMGDPDHHAAPAAGDHFRPSSRGRSAPGRRRAPPARDQGRGRGGGRWMDRMMEQRGDGTEY